MNGEHSSQNPLDQLQILLNKHTSTSDRLINDQVQQLIHELKTQRQQQSAQLQGLEQQLTKLEQQNQQYRQFFSAAPIGYVITDTEGEIQYVNQTLLEWLGVEQATLEVDKLLFFIEPSEQHIYLNHWVSLITTKENQDCELTLLRPNGGHIHVHLNSMFVPNGGLCQTAITDITHLHHAEEAYTKLVEHSPIAFVIMRHGQVLQANQSTADLLGYEKPEELEAMTPAEFMALVHPDSREKLMAYHKARFEGKEVPNYHEYKAFRKDGAVIWVQMHLSTISYQGELAVQCASVNITERKLAEARQHQLQDDLEQLVKMRTAALSAANKRLQDEIAQRQQVENLLRQSEISFRSLAEHSSDFITRLARDSTHLYANPAYLQAMNLSLDEVIGKSNTDLGVPTETQSFFDTGREYVFTHKVPYSLDFTYEIGGDAFHFNTRIDPEFDVDGTIKSLLTITRDITERKKAENRLLEDKKRLQTLSENLSGGAVYQIARTPDGDVYYPFMGESVKEIVGIKAEVLMADSHKLSQLIHPDDRAIYRLEADLSFKNLTQFDLKYRYCPANGAVKWVHCRSMPRKLKDGTVIWNGILMDITDQQAMEMALEERESLYHTLINAAPIAIRIMQNGRYVYCNETSANMLGYDHPDELLNKRGISLILPAYHSLIQKRVDRVSQGKKNGRAEIEMYRKDGSTVLIESISVPVTYKGQPGVLIFARDLTERKQAEAQALELVVEKEKARVIEQFLRDASHDLRTPLTGILSTTYLLKRTNLANKQIKWVNRLENQAQRLRNILDEMFNIVKLELNTSFEFAPTEINPLIEYVLREYNAIIKQRQLIIDFLPSSNLPVISADSHHLLKAITAVIRNALDYTHINGEVFIQTAVNKQDVIIEVRDNGIGISADDLPHVFKRFYRGDKARGTQKGGGGLGLSVAHTIIEKHQGTIILRSEVDMGTIVQINLPINMSN